MAAARGWDGGSVMGLDNYYRVRFTVRPLDGWPRPETKYRKRSPFDSSWSSTVDTLAREVKNLGATDAVLQADIADRDMRRDGWIRAGARPTTPRVALTVMSNRGPLTFRCDRWDGWQDNVRAIALGLEALRKVERYGITDTHEQYRGFGALPAASGGPTSIDAAKTLLIDASGSGANLAALRDDPDGESHALKLLYRRAVKRTHPDVEGGSAEAFERVQAAASLLGVA